MAFEGSLEYLDIAHLFDVLDTSQKSGVLECTWEGRRVRMLFEAGRIVCAEGDQSRDGIGELLVQSGILRREDLERALAAQAAEATTRSKSRRLGAILCDDFGVLAEDIERVLARQFEEIVLEAFSWPGGSFTFDFGEPAEVRERFHLDPVEFILSVGIQAGLLAKEGIDQARSAVSRPPVLFYDHNAELSAKFCTALRAKGWHVTAFSQAEEVLGSLKRSGVGPRPPVVVGDLQDSVNGGSGGSLFQSLQALSRSLPMVVFGKIRGPEPDSAAPAETAAFLPGPRPEQFLRAEGEARFDAFVTLLEQTVIRVARRG
jgi:hypothetical protein